MYYFIYLIHYLFYFNNFKILYLYYYYYNYCYYYFLDCWRNLLNIYCNIYILNILLDHFQNLIQNNFYYYLFVVVIIINYTLLLKHSLFIHMNYYYKYQVCFILILLFFVRYIILIINFHQIKDFYNYLDYHEKQTIPKL